MRWLISQLCRGRTFSFGSSLSGLGISLEQNLGLRSSDSLQPRLSHRGLSALTHSNARPLAEGGQKSWQERSPIRKRCAFRGSAVPQIVGQQNRSETETAKTRLAQRSEWKRRVTSLNQDL